MHRKLMYSIHLLSLGMINTLWLLERSVSGVGTDTAHLISTDCPCPYTDNIVAIIFLKTQTQEFQNFISFYKSPISFFL